MGKYFAYSPDGGLVTFGTEEEARNWAQSQIDDIRDSMDEDGWPEEFVDGICWGVISQKAVEGGNCTTGFDYELRGVDD